MYDEIFGRTYPACLKLDWSTFHFNNSAFEGRFWCIQQKLFKENEGSGERST